MERIGTSRTVLGAVGVGSFARAFLFFVSPQGSRIQAVLVILQPLHRGMWPLGPKAVSSSLGPPEP